MNIRVCRLAIAAALALAGGRIFAANNPPLSGLWNIAATGTAASRGTLLFRITRGDGDEPVDVTVPVPAGASDVAVAGDIRNVLNAQLRPGLFAVELGEGANVLVRDARGKPGFSLELIDSNVKELRVAVRSVAATALPTVPEQREPANPPDAPAPGNSAPGNVSPPPGNAIPLPENTAPPRSTLPPPREGTPPPNNSIPVPPPAPATPPSAPPPSR